jgi:hypothetical protein
MQAFPQILGQVLAPPLVNSTLFAVPDGFTAEFSIFINNRSQEYDGFSIALVPNNAGLPQNNEYLAYRTQLIGGGTVAFSGLYLNSGDTVFVSSDLGNCAFTATGIYFSP